MIISAKTEEVSKVLQDFLSVLPVYEIPSINFLSCEKISGYIHSIPFSFKYPEEYIGNFGTFISNIEERLEYTGENKTVYFYQLSKDLDIPEMFREQIRRNSGVLILENDEFCVRILKAPPSKPWEHPIHISISPADGTAYGSILSYSPKCSLEYCPEDMVRDLIRSPYNLVIPTDIRKDNIGSDHYNYMYTGCVN